MSLLNPKNTEMKIAHNMLDINKLKMKVSKAENDDDRFILCIYINSDIKDNPDKILNSLMCMILSDMRHTHEKYDHGMFYDFDREMYMYNVILNIKMQDISFFKEIIEIILRNTKDKTTKIYNDVSKYLEGLKNNDAYISYETYAYINHFFKFETRWKQNYRDIYDDMENTEIRKSIDYIRIHTKCEAMNLLKQVTSYFSSVINYCIKNNQIASVISDTIPELGRKLIRSVRAEFYPKKVSDDSTYVDINVYVGSDFIIGRRFNTDYGKVTDAPMYKLVVSDILK